MSGQIAQQPLVQDLLRHLAESRGKDDPVGSFALTVLNGEASLQDAAQDSWHSQGMADAVAEAEKHQRNLPAEERHRFEAQALRIRRIQEDAEGENKGSDQP